MDNVDLVQGVLSRVYFLVRWGAFTAGIVGIIGGALGTVFYRNNFVRRNRSKQVIKGGWLTVFVVVIANYLYTGIVWIMTGETGFTEGAFLGTGKSYQYSSSLLQQGGALTEQATMLSQGSALLGYSLLVGGVALWSLSKQRSRFRQKGYNGVIWGIALLTISVGGRIFAAISYIFAPTFN